MFVKNTSRMVKNQNNILEGALWGYARDEEEKEYAIATIMYDEFFYRRGGYAKNPLLLRLKFNDSINRQNRKHHGCRTTLNMRIGIYGKIFRL